jgi:NAD(P)-dependent dehydrogenase (short-subunit alcohol dehydrogenase family)
MGIAFQCTFSLAAKRRGWSGGSAHAQVFGWWKVDRDLANIPAQSGFIYCKNRSSMSLDFKGRVAIVTGAGGGLGRQHALALAARGAKVLVNDLGAAVNGNGGSVSAAQAVVDEIRALGGEALANGASVTDYTAVQAMVQQAVDAWGRVDILVNNAGILRDKSFSKMEMDDFKLVIDVHLMGAAHCSKAVWPHMLAQKYGRIVMTTSSSGLYGNFGQANYGAAKMALVGLMQTLSIEGAKSDIRVNCLAPTAATRMTEGLMPQEVLDALKPEFVVPAMLVLAHNDAPNRVVLCAGAGTFEAAHITLTQGVHIGSGPDAPDRLAAHLAAVRDRAGETVPVSGSEQGMNEISKAKQALAQ